MPDHDLQGPPTFLKRFGILAGGVATLGYFAVWPLYEASNHVDRITISFKGILLGGMLTAAGCSAVFLGEKGIPWRKGKSEPLNAFQKFVVKATVGIAILVTGVFWLVLHSLGYAIKFSAWETLRVSPARKKVSRTVRGTRIVDLAHIPN